MDFARKDTPIDRAIASISFTEDGITTTATATLDNGFVVVGKHSFERAKHFVLMEGRAGAVDDVRSKVLELLHFRELDANRNRAPSERTRASDNGQLPVPPEAPAPEDDTLHIRITDADGNVVVDAEFDPDVTPVDAEPGSEPVIIAPKAAKKASKKTKG
jgi:hypothetical protein